MLYCGYCFFYDDNYFFVVCIDSVGEFIELCVIIVEKCLRFDGRLRKIFVRIKVFIKLWEFC